MTNSRALIIGGSGFVGSALVPALRTHGYMVTVLNRGTRRVGGTEQLRADRLDPVRMTEVGHSADTFDVVIDTSAYSRRASEIAWEALAAKTSH